MILQEPICPIEFVLSSSPFSLPLLQKPLCLPNEGMNTKFLRNQKWATKGMIKLRKEAKDGDEQERAQKKLEKSKS